MNERQPERDTMVRTAEVATYLGRPAIDAAAIDWRLSGTAPLGEYGLPLQI